MQQPPFRRRVHAVKLVDAREAAQQLLERRAFLSGIQTLDLLTAIKDVVRPMVQPLHVARRNQVLDDEVSILVKGNVLVDGDLITVRPFDGNGKMTHASIVLTGAEGLKS